MIMKRQLMGPGAWRELIDLNTFIRNEKRSEIKYLSFYLKKQKRKLNPRQASVKH